MGLDDGIGEWNEWERDGGREWDESPRPTPIRALLSQLSSGFSASPTTRTPITSGFSASPTLEIGPRWEKIFRIALPRAAQPSNDAGFRVSHQLGGVELAPGSRKSNGAIRIPPRRPGFPIMQIMLTWPREPACHAVSRRIGSIGSGSDRNRLSASR